MVFLGCHLLFTVEQCPGILYQATCFVHRWSYIPLTVAEGPGEGSKTSQPAKFLRTHPHRASKELHSVRLASFGLIVKLPPSARPYAVAERRADRMKVSKYLTGTILLHWENTASLGMVRLGIHRYGQTTRSCGLRMQFLLSSLCFNTVVLGWAQWGS